MSTATDHLVIFTRYPEPGRVKTHLIPLLGAVGAADLQRRLTEHAVSCGRHWTGQAADALWVYHTGADPGGIREWLGDGLNTREQRGADLGARLEQALAERFDAGAKRALVVGSDIPDLAVADLVAGFNALQSRDVVVGPATDGGYYLIGCTAAAWERGARELFDDMPWSERNLSIATLDKAVACDLTVTTLSALPDIDEPEDLNRYQAAIATVRIDMTARG